MPSEETTGIFDGNSTDLRNPTLAPISATEGSQPQVFAGSVNETGNNNYHKV